MTGIDVRDGRVRGVRTDKGDIEAEVVVNAGGMYAAEIGRLAGVRVPIVPLAHEYLVTQPFRERGGGTCRRMRDPDLLDLLPRGGRRAGDGRLRARLGAVVAATRGGLDAIPPDFNGRLLEEDWDRFEEIVVNSRKRGAGDGGRHGHPAHQRAGGVHARRRVLPRRDAGRAASSSPPASARTGWPARAAIGKVMAEWIAEGEPSLDLWHMDIRRFGAHYRSPRYTLARTREVYETYYDIKYPGHERQAGRPLRLSPAYAWHAAHGAAFGEKSGWERVNWYEANAAAGDEALRPRGWAGQPLVAGDRRRARAPAARPPRSSTSPRSPSSRSPARTRRRSSSGCRDNRVAREPGRITYTQMLNRRGGIECDFTVTRLAEDRFAIVTGTAFGGHDLAWIAAHVRRGRRRARRRRHVAVGVLRAVGAARPARSSPAAARTTCAASRT